jgi:hypothetical protein
VRAGLLAAIGVSVIVPWVGMRWPALLLVIAAGIAYGIYWVPGAALLSDGAEAVGLEQGFGFALLNVAWAPANVLGTGLSGALTEVVGVAGAYLLAAGLCVVTLAALQRAVFDRGPAPETGSA